MAYTDSIVAAFRPRGAAGRWSSRGVSMVYSSEHPALAALEVLTAWDSYQDFSAYHLYRCRFAETFVQDAVVDLQADALDVIDRRATQAYGDAWAQARTSVVLRVPSVVTVASYNYLMNPEHREFESAVQRESLGPYRFDPRLLELLDRAKRP